MATHSSILAWKIPRTEECGRLHSMGSQRVGHDERLHLHFHFSNVQYILIFAKCKFWFNIFYCLWQYNKCRYLFDEIEETPAGIQILAFLLCTFLSSIAAECRVDRFLDGSHHLLGCNRMKEKSCEHSQDFTHQPFVSLLRGENAH